MTHDPEPNALDVSNPKSIAALVSEDFRGYIAKIPDEWLNRSEVEIIQLCYSESHDGHPPPLDIVLRQRFWMEYESAITDDRRIKVKNLFTGICSEISFYRTINKPNSLAYILTEPATDKFHAIANLGLAWPEMRKILLTEPGINNKTGLPDSKVWDLKVKIFQYLDQRQHGTPIQRIKQETTQTNLNVDMNKAQQDHTNLSMEDTNKLIAELQEKIANRAIPPEPKLVLPVEQAHRDAKKAEVER